MMNNKTSAIMASVVTAILTVTVLTTVMQQAFASSHVGTVLSGGTGGAGGRAGDGGTNINLITAKETVHQDANGGDSNGGNGGDADCIKSDCSTTVK
jgi:hypothetical protein